MKVRRPRHRCPNCSSNNIYKRTFSPIYTEKSRRSRKKIRNEIGEVVYRGASKKYRCIACRYEFDAPIIE
jgi:DNA-directed RNA polymerase subunit RPC12/RpoP